MMTSKWFIFRSQRSVAFPDNRSTRNGAARSSTTFMPSAHFSANRYDARPDRRNPT